MLVLVDYLFINFLKKHKEYHAAVTVQKQFLDFS